MAFKMKGWSPMGKIKYKGGGEARSMKSSAFKYSNPEADYVETFGKVEGENIPKTPSGKKIVIGSEAADLVRSSRHKAAKADAKADAKAEAGVESYGLQPLPSNVHQPEPMLGPNPPRKGDSQKMQEKLERERRLWDDPNYHSEAFKRRNKDNPLVNPYLKPDYPYVPRQRKIHLDAKPTTKIKTKKTDLELKPTRKVKPSSSKPREKVGKVTVGPITGGNIVKDKKQLSFGEAFKKNRKAGKKEFTWKGKRFHTRIKGETKAQWLEKFGKKK